MTHWKPKQPLNDNAELLNRIECLERALHMRTQHTVNKGDTLSSIALLYYGKSNQWQSIYRANKHVIGNNPDHLNVGQVLTLPRGSK